MSTRKVANYRPYSYTKGKDHNTTRRGTTMSDNLCTVYASKVNAETGRTSHTTATVPEDKVREMVRRLTSEGWMLDSIEDANDSDTITIR
jgi:hypothetical protein